ncbi:MAG: putative toxin-antitoxin system toxin component, PIN family [Chloroflexi bacterium]|nr:putative toxin-antitoxin system toxin component, PIN family [Chloroflexota bacterium]
MKVVLDTNVIVSALNFPGNERQVLDMARMRRYTFYLSPFIVEETVGVLQRKFGWSAERATAAIELLLSWATLLEPEVRVSAIAHEHVDNRVLECAVESGADFLVTGDRQHLLPLGTFQGVRIVTAREFLASLEAPG